MSNFDTKQFLSYEGLEKYDELIKKFISETAGSNEVVQSLVADLAEAQNSITALDEAIQENEKAIADNAAAIEVLNGEGEGSVKKQVKDAVDAIVDGAPEALDTLKELADWIAEDETASAALIEKVNDNAVAISENKEAINEVSMEYKRDDAALYNSIQLISIPSIENLFKNKVEVAEGESLAAAIADLKENEMIVLAPEAKIAEDIVVPAGVTIDAKGAELSGKVEIAEGAIVENAVFSGEVIVG